MSAVTELKQGATVEELLASMPYSLTRLLNVDEDGWETPKELTAAEIQAAKARLGRAEALLKPADEKLVRNWLGRLGVLCAGQMTSADAKIKIENYVPLLKCPASVLNQHTLEDAGRRFKWFPSYAEIAEFIDGKTWVMRKLAARLKMLSETTPQLEHQPGSDWKTLSQEQKDAIDAKLAQAKAIIDGVADKLRTPG